MKIKADFLKVFGTVEMILNGVLYFAIILIQVFYPQVSFLQLLIASIVILAVQGLFKYSKSEGDKQLLEIFSLLKKEEDEKSS